MVGVPEHARIGEVDVVDDFSIRSTLLLLLDILPNETDQARAREGNRKSSTSYTSSIRQFPWLP
jgi:hypothetical protein